MVLISHLCVCTVVGETSEIQVTPSVEVKASPGLKPDRTALCERIHIHGLPRFKHMDKYAHSLKLIVNASTGGKVSNVDVCFHRSVHLFFVFVVQTSFCKFQ